LPGGAFREYYRNGQLRYERSSDGTKRYYDENGQCFKLEDNNSIFQNAITMALERMRIELNNYLLSFVKYCCTNKDVAPGDMAILPEIAKILLDSLTH